MKKSVLEIPKLLEGTGPIWQGALAGPNRMGHTNAKALDAAKLFFVNGLPPDIRECNPDAVLERNILESLLTQAKKDLSAKENEKLVAFVARSLLKGRSNLRWEVAIPAMPIPYHREPSCFRPDRFILLHKARAIQQAVINLRPSDDRKFECGRILLSAILFGGMLEKRWIVSWLKALEEHQVFCYEQFVWIEMTRIERYGHLSKDGGNDGKRIRGEGQEIAIHRRWFPDPVSRLLICRWLTSNNAQGHAINTFSEMSSINYFLKEAGLEACEKIADLFGMGEMALRLKLPPNIASYATGTLVSVSLPAPVWARILCGRPVPYSYSDKEQNEALKANVVPRELGLDFEQSSPAGLSYQQDYLKELRKMLGRKMPPRLSREDIRRHIREVIQTRKLSDINYRLFQWSDYLLSRKSATVDRYLGAVGSYLIAASENEEFIEQEPSWYEALYDQVLDYIKSEKEKSYARDTLGRLHKFLVIKFGAPHMEAGYFISRKGPPEDTVDANLVTCHEFDRIKHALHYNDPNRAEVATAAIILAILGFRCGLRRNEAYHLRVRDIQGDRFPEIVLRPYSRRGLKTRSATRRIPLHILLPKEELDLVISWHKDRAADGNAPLFSKKSYRYSMYDAQQLFGPIRDAMHGVTGDKTLRFHHLRHSCVTWLFLRLNGDASGIRNWGTFLDHPEFDADRVLHLRLLLPENEQLGLKGLYAITLLCGHADPSTTIRNYIHVCDFLLGQQFLVSNYRNGLKNNQIVNLSGLRTPTAYKYYDKETGVDWKRILSAVEKSVKLKKPVSMNTAFKYIEFLVDYPKVELLEMRWLDIMRAISLFQVKRLSVNTISDKIFYPEDKIRLWISNLQYLAKLKVPGKLGGYRHRVIAQHLDLSGHDTEGREAWVRKEGVTAKSYTREPKHSTGTRAKHPEHRMKEWRKSPSQQVHPEYFPMAPKSDSDRKLLDKIMKTFEKLTGIEKESVIDFAGYFCENFVINSGGIWYNSIQCSQNHIRALQLLGLPQSSIQLVDFETKVETYNESLERRKNWTKKLAIKKATWVTSGKRVSMKRISCGISVRIKPQVGRSTSYAFRYAMYLIRIGYSD